MDISFEGIGQLAATFAKEEGVEVGMAVCVTANDTVGLGADGAAVCGVVIAAKEDTCAVQMEGFVEVPYTGTAPALGYGMVACDGAGAIKSVTEGGMNCHIVRVDEDNMTAVIKL